jgi:hypothetical protein
MKKGNYSIRYNPDKLREMIEAGKTAKEITKAFQISPYTLREHLVMLQELDKKIYVVKGLFDYSQAEQPKVKKEESSLPRRCSKKPAIHPVIVSR